jgi:hypothetical protein
MELEVKASKHGFRVCVLFDLDEKGEIRQDTKQFVVVGPDGRIYYPAENTIDAAIAQATLLDDEAEESSKPKPSSSSTMGFD